MVRSIENFAACNTQDTVFAFLEPQLQRESSVFVRDERREPILRIDFGKIQANIALAQVRSTLEIPAGSPDIKLLGLVGVALHFVREIRNGDPFPSELISGRPSWTPRSHLVARARERLELVLKTSLTEAGALAERASVVPSNAPMLLQALVRSRVRTEDLEELVASIARIDWLSRAVMRIQGTVGEMATLSAKRQSGRQSELVRAAALGLREAAVWGTARAMLADALVSDLPRLIVGMRHFSAALWGHIATLRPFVLDMEPILELWSTASQRDGGPSEGDLDAIARIVRQRCVPFQPTRYEQRPQINRASGGFDV